jgi:acyl transferase domain-containing protein
MSVLNNVDYLATLVSYKFDFHGPACPCSAPAPAPVRAFKLACQSLQLGQCDTPWPARATWSCRTPWIPVEPRRRAVGRRPCRPFDASASGTIFTNGGAAVILGGSPHAIAEGERGAGSCAASGSPTTGRRKVSFSAPSVSGQVRSVTDAWRWRRRAGAMSLWRCTPPVPRWATRSRWRPWRRPTGTPRRRASRGVRSRSAR